MRNRSNNDNYEIQRIHFSLISAERINTDVLWDEIIKRVKYYDSFSSIPDEPFSSLPNYYPLKQADIKGSQTGLPDVIYEDENFIMGIEHFEFDSSKRNRKGSSLRKEESIIDSKIRDSIQNNEITESNNKIGFNVNTPLTFQYYVDSLIYAFRQHSSHAIGYKEALKQLYPNKTIILCFFIDDVTAIGNYIKRDNKLIPLFPSRIPLFLNELLSHPEIEYVVSRFEEFYIPNLYFLKNTPDNLLYEMKNTIKLNDTFFSYNYRIETNVHHTNKK